MSPDNICSLFSSGRVKLLKIIYKNPSVIIPLRDVFWRQMCGHLKRVESSEIDGIIWGIGYDNTAYVYTGGWGGLFLKGMESSSTGINTMIDTHNYYIYENQRWNPISGFSTASLPTDRHMWSDITGKHKRSKEHTKLLSMHWQWVCLLFSLGYSILNLPLFIVRFQIGWLIFILQVVLIERVGNMPLTSLLRIMPKNSLLIMFVDVDGTANVA